MTRFDGQNRAGCCEVFSAHDVGCSTQIGADTDTLENGIEHDEGFGVADAKVVGACCDWGGAGFFQSVGQESNMGHFVEGDGLQVSVKGGVESGTSEVGFAVIGETLTVESVLEMLEGESIVEDVCVCNGR